MSFHNEAPLKGAALCLALVVAGYTLFFLLFEWPTTWIVQAGYSLEAWHIWVFDVVPIIAIGFAIGLCAMGVTSCFLPHASIKLALYTIAVPVTLLSLFLLYLSAAIAGTPTDRDIGTVGQFVATLAGIGAWPAIRSALSR